MVLNFDKDGELVKPVEGLGINYAKPVLLDSSIPPDPWVVEKMAKYQQFLEPYKEVVGDTEVRLVRHDGMESNMGNFIADTMLAVWDEAQVWVHLEVISFLLLRL